MKKSNIFLLLFIFTLPAVCQPSADKSTEVIYGRKDGMALTMIISPPSVPSNGKGVIWVVSAGWTSDYSWIQMFKNMTRPLADRGYTIFYVMHGSQPKYAANEALPDLKKAIRFIRLHASDYGIDPSHIGISGVSAGGHLSLLAGTTGDDGNPEGKEAVEKISSRIQAVACFYPPTDLLNWKQTGDNAVIKREIKEFQAPLDFVEWNAKTLHYNLVTDSVKRTETGRTISPYYFVTADDAPAFIVHGDADKLVPLFQSQRMIEKLKEFNVPSELKIRPGGGHGFWNDMNDYVIMFADWFDKYLK